MNEIFQDWLKQRTNFKHLKDWNPSIVEKTIEYHNLKTSGFISRVITGNPGYGKSTFAFKLIAKVYWVLNNCTEIEDEEKCYQYALDNMMYQPQELLNRVAQQLQIRKPALIWCLDDASIHMGRQLWDQDRQMYRDIQDVIPTIREHVTCLLITTPNVKLLMKPLREFFDVKMIMQLEEGIKRYKRRGKHYFRDYYPDDVHYCMHHPFDDMFSCLVPEPFYTWYRNKKLDALELYHKNKKNRTHYTGEAPEEHSGE